MTLWNRMGLLGIVCCLAATALAGQIIYVDDSAPPGGNGATWNNAFRFLQDALAIAAAGDEIRVGQGTYCPDRDAAHPNGTGDRTATFQLKSGVALYGGYAGSGAPDPDARDITTYETILRGDFLGNDGPDWQNYEENAYHVVTGSGCDRTAVLDGVSITAGNAEQPPDSDCCFPHSYPGCQDPACESVVCLYDPACCSFGWDALCAELAADFCDTCAVQGDGGGMYTSGGSPTLTRCTFRENAALRGGGMYTLGGNALLTNCVFAGNLASGADDSFTDGGGAVYCVNSSPTLVDCAVTANVAQFHGSGILCVDHSAPTIEGCVITGNSTPTWWTGGGGIACIDHSSPTIVDCTITENDAGCGGGVLCWIYSSPSIMNCVIAENSAGTDGGGIWCKQYCTPTIDNCQLSSNTTSGNGGGAFCHMYSSATIRRSTIVGNSAGDRAGGIGCFTGCSVLIRNCNIVGNSAAYNGGGVYCYGFNAMGYPTIADCTVTGNSAGGGGGGIACYWMTSPSLSNCIFWGDTAPSGSEIELRSSSYPSALSVSYSDIAGGQGATYVDPNCTLVWGIGNIDANPLFADPSNADYHLTADSPCIDAGDPSFVPQPGETDIDGQFRVWDGDGNGVACVDIGSDELGSFVFGDLNCDGELDFADINPFVLALSNAAGYEAAFPDCSIVLSDINGDGTYGQWSFDDINPFVDLITHL